MEHFAGIAEGLRRSTVQVRNGDMGAGSGVVWRADGLIVTNAHVVRGHQPSIELWDGRRFDAQVLSADPHRDLAALKIPAIGLPAASVIDSDSLRVGQLVVAVGNPLGLTGALSMGIIHAIAPARSHPGPAERHTWVQADVRLAPGNSGGPLSDVGGNVVGINSMVAGGLGLAVPSNAVQQFLRASGDRPRLGVTTQPVTVQADSGRAPGLLVLAVEEGSTAELAGLGIGDVLLEVDGERLTSPATLGTRLAEAGYGGAIHLAINRGGQLVHLTVFLPGTPSSATSGQDAA